MSSPKKLAAQASKTILARERAKGLKKLGLLDYDLRKTLSPQQKSAITRKYHKYADLLNRPYDFGTITAKKNIDKIPGVSFVTGRGQRKTLWIYKKPNERIERTRRGYDLIGGSYRESVTTIPAHDSRRVKKLFKDLKQNQYVMLRQGAKTPIRHVFRDLESFLDWAEHYRDDENAEWMSELSVFTIEGGVPDSFEEKRKHTRRRSEAQKAASKAWKKTPAGRAQHKRSEKNRLARRNAGK